MKRKSGAQMIMSATWPANPRMPTVAPPPSSCRRPASTSQRTRSGRRSGLSRTPTPSRKNRSASTGGVTALPTASVSAVRPALPPASSRALTRGVVAPVQTSSRAAGASVHDDAAPGREAAVQLMAACENEAPARMPSPREPVAPALGGDRRAAAPSADRHRHPVAELAVPPTPWV